MKTTKEWLKELEPDKEHEGNFYRLSSFTIEQIQLDAWKQGMTDAAKVSSDTKEMCASALAMRQCDIVSEYILNKASDKVYDHDNNPCL